MICYRDQTMCREESCINFKDNCDRAMTPKEKARATAWWNGPGYPVSYYDHPKKLDCYEPKKEVENES